jgi:acyl-CoA dehydrogenase
MHPASGLEAMTVLYIVSLVVLLFLAYRRSRLWVISLNLLVLGALACWPLGYAPMRNWFKTLLPPMSNTEREALEAGTVWWDGELFSGKPDFARLMRVPAASLSAEEQAFIEGPVETLCGMLDDWQINSADNDLPEAVWRYIREQGFLSMIIPKAYGGLEFSAQGNSAVVLKLASRSQTAAVTVMVPNSLGPGELLLHFGTDQQKQHYLPPCASTSTMAKKLSVSWFPGRNDISLWPRWRRCWGWHFAFPIPMD